MVEVKGVFYLASVQIYLHALDESKTGIGTRISQ